MTTHSAPHLHLTGPPLISRNGSEASWPAGRPPDSHFPTASLASGTDMPANLAGTGDAPPPPPPPPPPIIAPP